MSLADYSLGMLSDRIFVEPQLIHRDNPLKGEAKAHHHTANDYGPGEGGIDFSQVPGSDVYNDRKERQGNDDGLEPHWPQVSMAKNQTRNKEDKGYAEHVNVGDTHQGREAHACVCLCDLREIFVAVEIGDMRITAAVTAEAALLDNRFDSGIVCGLVETVV